jgi:hypothetical protein
MPPGCENGIRGDEWGERRLVMRPMKPLGGRFARWLGADGSPLRRLTDRMESSARVLLVLLFLVGGPLLASMAGRWMQRAGQDEMRQQQSWRRVNALVLQSAPRPFYSYGSTSTYWVPGRWRAPSGASRTGEVPAQAGVPAGTSVRIWVNGAGRLTGRPPLTGQVVVLRMVLAEVVAVGGLLVVLLLIYGLIRWQLHRRRMAYWAMEWAAFGPRWTTLR